MILNLATDTFIQQLIGLSWITNSHDDMSVTLNRAIAYGSSIYTTVGLFNLPEVESFWQGLSVETSKNLSSPPLACSTGNCTYPMFESLGICNSCTDVSHLLRLVDGPQAWVKSLDAEENQWVATKSFTHGNITITNVVNATFWSSGNTYLPSVSNFTATTLSKAWQFLPQWPAPGTGSEIIVQQFINPDSSNLGYILNVTMVNLTNLESLKNWPTGADLVALECSLTWCLQNVTSSLTNNILTQTFSPLPNTSLTYVDLSNTPITQPNNGINEFNLTSAFGTREKYSVMVPDMAEMADLLLDQLLWSGSDTTGNNTEYDVPLAQVGFGNTAEPMGSPALQAIYSHGNFTDTFDNLARALTNALFASDNTTTVYGSLGVSSIVMTVQWYWLALPFFNVVAAAVFIRITVAASSRANAPLWKANLLPVLFHGFLHNEGDENDEVASKKKMKSLRRGTAMHRFAKTVDVKLEGVEDGGRGAALSATRRRLRNRKGRDSAQYMAV